MNPPADISTHELDPTGRFTDRVDFYTRYRPAYPKQILDILKRDCGFNRASVVADIGSGTGILSKLFLQNGNTVFGIEPNSEMRKAGEQYLKDFSNFVSVQATAESTKLMAKSVDFIAAGQAFHWFDIEKCKIEFHRVVKDAGWLVLIWNDRLSDTTPFLKAYENLLHTHGTDYNKVQHRTINKDLVQPVFGSLEFRYTTFENSQVLDYESLEGRLLSSSYVPNKSDPGYESMIEALHSMFDEFQTNGEVRFEYETKMFYGQLNGVRFD